MKLLLELVHGTDIKLKFTTNYATIKIDLTKHKPVPNQSLVLDGRLLDRYYWFFGPT